MITIIDYGIGNLRSIEKAFEAVGADVLRSDQREDIERAEKVVLPGVGAFGACAGEIRRRGLEEPILEAVDSGKPFLGVCVGMQLLFDVGEEMGSHQGLGVLPGRVLRFDAVPKSIPASATAGGTSDFDAAASTMHGGDDASRAAPRRPDAAPFSEATGAASEAEDGWNSRLKIPHMGWNTIMPRRDDPLLSGLAQESYFYFVHSFVAVPDRSEDVLASSRYGIDFPAVVQRNNVFGVQFHPEKSQHNGLRILRNFAELA